MIESIGVVGLGNMGLPIAKTLKAAGFDVTATSRSAASRTRAADDGVRVVDTLAEVVERVRHILISVFDTAAVLSVVRGEGGILSGLRDGSVVVDLGTTEVATTLSLAKDVANRGGVLVDAPVSGGTRGAAQGTLTILAGGSAEAIGRVAPILSCLGRLNHMGPIGAGQCTKAVNQLILGQTLVAVAEGLALARSLHLDPAAVREALLGGFAESRVLQEHGKRMVEEQFAPGGSIAVFDKDLRQVRALAREAGLSLPGLDLAAGLYALAASRGMSGLDQSAIIRLCGTRASKRPPATTAPPDRDRIARGWWPFKDGVAP